MSPNTTQTKPENKPLRKPVPVLVMDLESVAEVLTLSVSTVQELVRREVFPAPRLLSRRRVGWLIREVEDWLESRPVSTLPPPPNTGAKKPRPSRAEGRAAA
jgi:prophage regulatory protein